MSERAKALERTLRKNIPLTAAMAVRVVRADGDSVVLAAPLAPNINHHRTFFGGSAATLATLTAWGLAEEKLRDDGLTAHLVIQRSTMEYLEPAVSWAAERETEWAKLADAMRRGEGEKGVTDLEQAAQLRAMFGRRRR